MQRRSHPPSHSLTSLARHALHSPAVPLQYPSPQILVASSTRHCTCGCECADKRGGSASERGCGLRGAVPEPQGHHVHSPQQVLEEPAQHVCRPDRPPGCRSATALAGTPRLLRCSEAAVQGVQHCGLTCCPCPAAFLLWMGISHGWFLQLLSCCCKMLFSATKRRHREEGATLQQLSL